MSDPIASNPGFKYLHVAGTLAATQVSTRGGILKAISLNTTGATPGTITVQDGTIASPTTIAIITPVASSTATTLEFNVVFNTGLVITATGSTEDFTVSWF